MATFADREWATGYEDPLLFTPTKLDCGQWADAAKAAGMKYAVLTAKHGTDDTRISNIIPVGTSLPRLEHR